MAKNIMISDGLYFKLKTIKEMRNESFSEVITELVNNNKTKKMKNLKEVYGLLEGNKEHDKVWRDTLKKGWNKWNKKYA
ncbi:hypothetical protein J4442_00370 [Candidatus Woesearchaeota archaeon]|nr:hypothetical protein [Candidatus Woesearchaeota archaeon]